MCCFDVHFGSVMLAIESIRKTVNIFEVNFVKSSIPFIFSLEFALPGCLLSIIYCSLPSWLSTFYIYLLEVYLPNSAIYIFLSSELIGADAAVIGVVFVVQSLSFLLT